MSSNFLSFFYEIFKANFIVFINSIMPLSSLEYFLHIFSITVHIDDSKPVLYTNHKNLYAFSNFDIAFFAYLQILQLEYSRFTFLHTCN